MFHKLRNISGFDLAKLRNVSKKYQISGLRKQIDEFIHQKIFAMNRLRFYGTLKIE